MAKKVFTARQIEKKFENGERTLVLDQNVVLTDMAYEKARQLGMELVSDQMNPSPSAPIRPYLSKIKNLVVKETVQAAAPPLVTEPIWTAPHNYPKRNPLKWSCEFVTRFWKNLAAHWSLPW